MYRKNFPEDPGMHNTGDSHTRVTYRTNPTFLERIGQSLVGILVGIGMLCGACALLFWNEGRAVQTAQSLDEGLNVVVPLINLDVAFENNNGKLVHLTGSLRTDKLLSDQNYGVAVPSVKLKRVVAMYQWIEHESTREYNEGDQTRTEKTYSYTTEWRSDLIRSASFDNPVGHTNPTSMAVESVTQTASDVRVGNFHLSKVLIEKVTDYKKLDATTVPSGKSGIQVFDGVFYHGHSPTNPQVGDLRVTFEYAGLGGQTSLGSPAVVSLVARQLGTQLLTFNTVAGDDLELLYFGDLSPKEIFQKEHAQNTMMTWAIRFGGWLLMFVGFGCLTSIVRTLVDWLPIVRELVGMGVGLMNLGFSISLSLTVIALGWIRYRPLLGMAILAMAATPFILSRLKGQKQRSQTEWYRDRAH